MKIISGDMVAMALDGKFDVIVQGCNCFCRMENGLAGQIARDIPEAVIADNRTIVGDRNKLGTYSAGRHTTDSGHTVTVINAYTQFERRREEGEDLVEYDALREVLGLVAAHFPAKRIAVPLIGAGIACGDWIRIERIILDELSLCDATIVHFRT